MSPEDAILTIALLAAFADDVNDEREREHLRRTAESLGAESHDLARLYQNVLLKRVTLADAVQAISDIGQRQLAYEMAVCVCNADGETCAAEKRFLSQLRSELALEWDASSSHAAMQAARIAQAAEADIEEAVPATGQTQASPADARPAGNRSPRCRAGSASRACAKSTRSSSTLYRSWLCCAYMTSTGLRSMMMICAFGANAAIS